MLAFVTDGEGRRWTYTYGAFDVLQAIEDPKGGRLSFAYDGEGRVIAVTNQMGVTYHLIRDARRPASLRLDVTIDSAEANPLLRTCARQTA